MQRQAVGEFEEPPFVHKLRAQGALAGEVKGKAEALKEVLRKLIARAGIALGEEERAQIEACADPAVLDRWVDNALDGKTAKELFQ